MTEMATIDLASVRRQLGSYNREPASPVRPTRELPTAPLADIGVCSESELLAQLHTEELYPQLPLAIARVMSSQLRRTSVAAHYLRMAAPAGDPMGSSAWVLLVVLRTPEHHIVLRLRPRVLSLLGRTQSVYNLTRAAELETLTGLGEASGQEPSGRERAARAGQAHVDRLVRESGFDDIDDFTAALLQAEAIAWTRDAPANPTRVVGQLSQVIRSTCAVAAELGDSRRLAELSEALGEAAADLEALTRDLAELTAAAFGAGVGVAEAAPILANTAHALDGKWRSAAEQRQELGAVLGAAQAGAERVRMLAATADLLQSVVRHVVKGRITSFAVPALNDELQVLCETLAFCAVERVVAAAELRVCLDQVSVDLRRLLGCLEEYHRWLSRFRLLVTKAGLWSHFGDFITRLDAHLVGVAGTERLRAVAALCAEVPEPNADGLAVALAELSEVFAQRPSR